VGGYRHSQQDAVAILGWCHSSGPRAAGTIQGHHITTPHATQCCEQAAPRWLFAGSYARTFVRPSWTGTSWKGRAGQGPAIRTRQVLDRQGFPMCICIYPSPGRIGSNKQCFHNQYIHTCLLRATLSTLAGRVAYPPQKIGHTFYKCILIPQSSCSSSL
jgi:hypothetical protein